MVLLGALNTSVKKDQQKKARGAVKISKMGVEIKMVSVTFTFMFSE
jgi:hypothetical protein